LEIPGDSDWAIGELTGDPLERMPEKPSLGDVQGQPQDGGHGKDCHYDTDDPAATSRL